MGQELLKSLSLYQTNNKLFYCDVRVVEAKNMNHKLHLHFQEKFRYYLVGMILLI